MLLLLISHEECRWVSLRVPAMILLFLSFSFYDVGRQLLAALSCYWMANKRLSLT